MYMCCMYTRFDTCIGCSLIVHMIACMHVIDMNIMI
jgi:hypothetical protein